MAAAAVAGAVRMSDGRTALTDPLEPGSPGTDGKGPTAGTTDSGTPDPETDGKGPTAGSTGAQDS